MFQSLFLNIESKAAFFEGKKTFVPKKNKKNKLSYAQRKQLTQLHKEVSLHVVDAVRTTVEY